MAKGDGYYEIIVDITKAEKAYKKLNNINQQTFKSVAQQAQTSAKKVENAHKQAAEKTKFYYTNSMKAINTIVGGALASLGGMLMRGLVRAGRDALKAFSDLDKGVREVSTLLNQTDLEKAGGLPGLKQQAQELAMTFGQDVANSTKAMYQAISAGTPVEKLGEQMETAGKLAVGGIVDLSQATTALNVVQNAWGESAGQAANISDTFFLGMKNGITTVGELSNNIGKVAPIASSMGVSFDEVTAAISTMTKQGIQTTKATTFLQNTIKGILKPSKEAAANMEKLGIEYGENALKNKELNVWLAETKQKLADNGMSVKDVFTNVRSMNGAMSLMSEQGGQDFVDILNQMKDAAGDAGSVTDEAFGKMEESVEMKMKRMKQGIQNVFINLFEQLFPVLEKLIPVIEKVGNALSAIFNSPAFKFIIDVVGGVADGITRLLDPVGQAAKGFDTLTESIQNTTAALQVTSELEVRGLTSLQASIRQTKDVAPELSAELQRIADSSLETSKKIAYADKVLKDFNKTAKDQKEQDTASALEEWAAKQGEVAAEYARSKEELEKLNEIQERNGELNEEAIMMQDELRIKMENAKNEFAVASAELEIIGITSADVSEKMDDLAIRSFKAGSGIMEMASMEKHNAIKELYEGILLVDMTTKAYIETLREGGAASNWFADRIDYMRDKLGKDIDPVEIPLEPVLDEEGIEKLEDMDPIEVPVELEVGEKRQKAFEKTITKQFKKLHKGMGKVTLDTWEQTYNNIEQEAKYMESAIKADAVMNETEKQAAIKSLNEQTLQAKKQLLGEELSALDSVKEVQRDIAQITKNETLSQRQMNAAIAGRIKIWQDVRAAQEGAEAAGSIADYKKQIAATKTEIEELGGSYKTLSSFQDTETKSATEQYNEWMAGANNRTMKLEELQTKLANLETAEATLNEQVKEGVEAQGSLAEAYDEFSGSVSQNGQSIGNNIDRLSDYENSLAIIYARIGKMEERWRQQGKTEEEIYAERQRMMREEQHQGLNMLQIQDRIIQYQDTLADKEDQRTVKMQMQFEMYNDMVGLGQIRIDQMEEELSTEEELLEQTLQRLELAGAGEQELLEARSKGLDQQLEMLEKIKEETLSRQKAEIEAQIQAIEREMEWADLRKKDTEYEAMTQYQVDQAKLDFQKQIEALRKQEMTDVSEIYEIESRLLGVKQEQKDTIEKIASLQNEINEYILGAGLGEAIKKNNKFLKDEVDLYTKLSRLLEEEPDRHREVEEAFIKRNVTQLTGLIDLNNVTEEGIEKLKLVGENMIAYYEGLGDGFEEVALSLRTNLDKLLTDSQNALQQIAAAEAEKAYEQVDLQNLEKSAIEETTEEETLRIAKARIAARERKEQLEEEAKLLEKQRDLIENITQEALTLGKALASAFEDGELTFEEAMSSVDQMLGSIAEQFGGALGAMAYSALKGIAQAVASLFQDSTVSKALKSQLDTSIKFNETLDDRNSYLQLAKDMNLSILDSLEEQLQYTKETNDLIAERYDLENKSGEEIAQEISDREDMLRELQYAIEDLDNVDWGAWFGLDQADDEFFKQYESLLNQLGFTWEGFKAGKYTKEEIMEALRTAKDLTDEEIEALNQYVNGLGEVEAGEEKLAKTRQNIILKRMELEGTSEQEIQKKRLQFMDEEIEGLYKQMELSGYSAEIEEQILDLELERKKVIQEINGELDETSWRYDDFIKSQIRSVIQARALGNQLEENAALQQAAAALAAYGLSPEEISQMLGTDTTSLLDTGSLTAATSTTTPYTNNTAVESEMETATQTGTANTDLIATGNFILTEQLEVQKAQLNAQLTTNELLASLSIGGQSTPVTTGIKKPSVTEDIRRRRKELDLVSR